MQRLGRWALGSRLAWVQLGWVEDSPQAPLHPPLTPQASRRSRQPAQDPTCTPWPLGIIPGTYQFGGPLPSYLEFTGIPAPLSNR